MSLFVGALSVLALVAAGWWPMRAWAAELAGPGWLGCVSVACALGAAITGLAQVALSAAGVPAHAAVPAVLAVVSLLMARRSAARRAAEPPLASAFAPVVDPANASANANAAPCPRPALFLRVLLLVVALVSAGASAGLPFRSDGSKFWAPRARELAESGASRAPALHDPARLAVHRDYPLLVPALLAPVFALSPPDAASGPKLVLAALNLALLGVLASQLLRCGTRGRLLLAVVATLPFLVALDVRESAVSGGYVDSSDALFLLLVVMCVERLRGGETGAAPDVSPDVPPGAAWSAAPAAGAGVVRRGALLAGLLAAALVSTKLEGAAELGIVAAAWLLTGPVRRPLLVCLGWAALLALPTFIIRAGVAPDPQGFLLDRLFDGQTLAARGVPVLAGLGGLVIDVSCFGLLPPLLLLWLLPRAAGRARSTRTLALWLLLGAAGLLFVSYITTNMQAERHIHTSAHRLAWHWLPALAWLAARVRAGDAAAGRRETVTP